MDDRQRRIHWAEIVASLASEPRLHIVELLSEDTVQCQEILARIDLSQPAISYHLAKLERAGVLQKERQGTRNCYRLRGELRTLIRSMMKEEGSWNTR
jgi:DNA-binding transcriptional ArsR family regulator